MNVQKLDYLKKGTDLFIVTGIEGETVTLHRMLEVGKKAPGRDVKVKAEKLGKYRKLDLPPVTVTQTEPKPPAQETAPVESEDVKRLRKTISKMHQELEAAHKDLEEEIDMHASDVTALERQIDDLREKLRAMAEESDQYRKEAAETHDKLLGIIEDRNEAYDTIDELRDDFGEVRMLIDVITRAAESVRGVAAVIENIAGGNV